MTSLEKIGEPPTRLGGTALYDWDYLVQEDRAHRLIYTDPAIFEVEMTQIFGGTWTYLAHESEIPTVNDFITRRLGLRPLIIVRDAEGRIRALYNRCTHRGTTLCRFDKGNSKSFQCPYHGWNFLNTGRLRGVPWPDGYAGDMRDPKYNLAQVPRVEVLSWLHLRHAQSGLAAAHRASRADRDGRSTNGSTAILAARSWFARRTASATKPIGSSPTTIPATAITSPIRTARCWRPRTALLARTPRAWPYYAIRRTLSRCTCAIPATAITTRTSAQTWKSGPAGLWALESAHPGMEHYEAEFISRYGDRAFSLLDLAGSEPVNINVFPNLSLLGNHIQVFEPVSVEETNAIWYGTMIVDDGSLGEEACATSTRCACAPRKVSPISAKSTTSPISSRSSAA